MAATALRSQESAVPGNEVFQDEMPSAASDSSVTTLRTAIPAHVHAWKALHQCSGPATTTGPWLSKAVPMPLVPLAHSDQVYHGARLLSVASRRIRWLP